MKRTRYAVLVIFAGLGSLGRSFWIYCGKGAVSVLLCHLQLGDTGFALVGIDLCPSAGLGQPFESHFGHNGG